MKRESYITPEIKVVHIDEDSIILGPSDCYPYTPPACDHYDPDNCEWDTSWCVGNTEPW